MFHGGGGGGFAHRHGGDQFDSDEVLGKVYDNRVVARLPKYLAPVKGWIGIGFIGIIFHTLSVLALPLMVGIAVNNIIEGDFGALSIVAILYVVILLAQWGGQYLETLYLAYAGQTIIYKMRTEMFEHLHRLSMSFFDPCRRTRFSYT